MIYIHSFWIVLHWMTNKWTLIRVWAYGTWKTSDVRNWWRREDLLFKSPLADHFGMFIFLYRCRPCRFKFVRHTMSRSMRQLLSHGTSWLTHGHPFSQSADQPVRLSAIQPVSHSTNQPVIQSTSQPVGQFSRSAGQPVSQSTSQPVSPS